jgi:hypothetical protein
MPMEAQASAPPLHPTIKSTGSFCSSKNSNNAIPAIALIPPVPSTTPIFGSSRANVDKAGLSITRAVPAPSTHFLLRRRWFSRGLRIPEAATLAMASSRVSYLNQLDQAGL